MMMDGGPGMWGFKSFLDNVIDNGFHISGDNGYYPNHGSHLPPPPAHNHHLNGAGVHHSGVPPAPSHHYHSHPMSTGPPGGYMNDMDIKMEPEPMMDNEYSPQSYVGTFGSSGSPSGSAGSPGEMGTGGRRKNKEDKLCGVCGDRALGYNFDAISCESCKAFFRRNAPKGLDYFKCPYDEKCKMDVSNRRFCKRCRLKKCFEIGMRKEYILTEEEKAKKRIKIETNRANPPNRLLKDIDPCRPGMVRGPEVSSQTTALSAEDNEEIEELLSAYRSSLDITTSKELPRDNTSSVMHLVNIAELSVRRVIDMVKKVKAFKSLPQSDQISLLKGGSIELLILRSVISFDKEKQHFLDPTDGEGSAMKVEQLASGEHGTGLFEEHMKFIKSLAIDMRTDQTMLILLLVISLFSPDRCNLDNKELVAEEQHHYSQLLEKYLESQFPLTVARSMYPRLLMKLTDIRNLNEEHSQVLLKVNPEGIQPLMQEVLDLQQKKAAAEAAAQAEAETGQAQATTPTEEPPLI